MGLIIMNLKKITRVVVVDENGVVCEKIGYDVEFSLQDNDKTLKIFLTPNEKKYKKTIKEMREGLGDFFQKLNDGTFEKLMKKFGMY